MGSIAGAEAKKAEAKRLYKVYRKNGGDPSEISKNAENEVARKIYVLVHSLDITRDGRRFTLAEKFADLDIPFTSRKTSIEDTIAKLRAEVAACADVNNLKKTDDLYKKVHGLKLVEKGTKRRLTMEEKFAFLGENREAKMSSDTRKDAHDAIQTYIDAGGDLYIQKTKLPFFKLEYRSFARAQRNRGVKGDFAFQTNLRELGFDYSEMFYQYGRALELARFKNSNGFVDGYRRDVKMDNFTKTSAYKLGLPIPVFVGLVGNCDLEGCYLDTEYFGFVRDGLSRYLKTHENFVGMSKIDKPLYEKLRHIGRMAFSVAGETLSTDDIVCLLGFDDVENDFGVGGEISDVSEILDKIRPIAMAKGGKLSKGDIPENEYRKLVRMIASTGATTRAFFNLYDIEYDGKDGQRLARVWVNGYPYMKEMRAERDRILAEHNVSMTGDCKKEDLFDVLIDASVQAFEKYRTKIFNFEAEKVAAVGTSEKVSPEKQSENQTNSVKNLGGKA